jgi:hypothetical protein
MFSALEEIPAAVLAKINDEPLGVIVVDEFEKLTGIFAERVVRPEIAIYGL